MAYNFKKLSEVDKVEEITDTTSVYVEVNGETKRVAKDKVGGASGLIVDLGITTNDSKVSVNGAAGPTSSYKITGLDQNYDFIYEALLKGASVYLHLVPSSSAATEQSAAIATLKSEIETPIEEYALVTAWMLNSIEGLFLNARFGDYIEKQQFLFPNGSYNTPSGE